MAKTVQRHRAELDKAIATIRQDVADLHLGGLAVEMEGAQFVAAGIVMTTWPGWVARTVPAQALLIGWLLYLVGWWITSDERLWWPSLNERA